MAFRWRLQICRKRINQHVGRIRQMFKRGVGREIVPETVWRALCAVARINYRLSQHAVFPAQIEDCKAAIRWLRTNAEKYYLDADHIGVRGSLAGDHLVATLGRRLRQVHANRARKGWSGRCWLAWGFCSDEQESGTRSGRRVAWAEEYENAGLYSLDNHAAIVGASEAMLAYLTIGGAVVPRLRRFEGGKFQDNHALDLRSFDHLLATVGGEHLDRVPAQGVANLLRIGLKF